MYHMSKRIFNYCTFGPMDIIVRQRLGARVLETPSYPDIDSKLKTDFLSFILECIKKNKIKWVIINVQRVNYFNTRTTTK